MVTSDDDGAGVRSMTAISTSPDDSRLERERLVCDAGGEGLDRFVFRGIV
jgi:hypothetical protein